MSTSCECPPEAGADTCEAHVAPMDARCPINQEVGKRVDPLTLKALLALPLSAVKSSAYRFCRAPDCPVVYYSADGA
jgi:hypothetical protein